MHRFWSFCCLAPALAGQTLYEQAMERSLANGFSTAGVSYVLVDGASGTTVAQRGFDRAVPVGSLVKPLLIWSERRDLPELVCDGHECGRPGGHGRLTGAQALAESCNSYFRRFAGELTQERVAAAAAQAGLEQPPPGADASTLIGMGRDWRIHPAALARAYFTFIRDARIREGLAGAAAHGTARAAGASVLAKTGTAPCSHGGAPGDGFALVLFPKEEPRYALLAGVHGTTGARAAITAGAMLRAITARATATAREVRSR